jgi:hypothetical protein
MIHRKKRFTSFPSPAGMSLTKLPLGRNNSVMTSLFPPRESLEVTSRLGTGNSRPFFYGVSIQITSTYIFVHRTQLTIEMNVFFSMDCRKRSVGSLLTNKNRFRPVKEAAGFIKTFQGFPPFSIRLTYFFQLMRTGFS